MISKSIKRDNDSVGMQKHVEAEVIYEEASGDTEDQGKDANDHPEVTKYQDAEASAHPEVPEYQDAEASTHHEVTFSGNRD